MEQPIGEGKREDGGSRKVKCLRSQNRFLSQPLVFEAAD